ncbi:MAG: biotin--[acetyl-CoA-carboxylase] ligase [Bacteroidales bacterium]|jgi:BirA family biotin operon repressor/biotin-[acetyl-CoA-carboxylase] ligase|nr:biotin--[acetyl-CoA-carboxylase] ligase [Bacteroidales bacterium]
MMRNIEIKWYETLDSTTSQALRDLDGAKDETVWTADYQTAGRGQRGNSWHSEKCKNLMFSILLRPCFLNVSSQFSISEISALSVLHYVKGKGLDAKIKWPNDIYVGDRKVSGILIDHSIMGDKMSYSILGIGVNLNQLEFDPNLPNPASVLSEMMKARPGEVLHELHRKEELFTILSDLFDLYDELKAGGKEHIHNEYMNNLYRFGTFCKFEKMLCKSDNCNDAVVVDSFSAKIVGLDPNFCLVLENEKGERKSFAFKEIRYVL